MSLHPLVTGALVADAAAMGLHWIYDQDHIARIAPDAPEFRTPSAADYDGVKGYFAHPTRREGDQSQYGEQVLVMQRSLHNGVYDHAAFAKAFHNHFGYGGAYVGYIDRATRDSLNNAIGVEDLTMAKGSDDDQAPAIAKLPPLVATMLDADDDAFFNAVDSAVAVTNENDISQEYGRIAAAMMRAAGRGDAVPQIVAAGRAHSSEAAAKDIDLAAASKDRPANDMATHFGMACYLRSVIPVTVHHIATCTSFTQAVRSNIYAGGDTCGRSVLLGAIMGAMHGVGGETGIPELWVERLTADLEG